MLLALGFEPALAQHQLSARFLYGWYLYNSENDIRVTKHQDLKSLMGGSFEYGYSLSSLMAVSLSFTYSESVAEDVLTLPRTTATGDLWFHEYTMDAAVSYRVMDWLEVRAGPSGSVISRSLVVSRFAFEDALSSRSLGLNGGANILIPVGDGAGLSAIGGIIFRYLHSISFDAAGRQLDGYSQNSVSTAASVGVAYQF